MHLFLMSCHYCVSCVFTFYSPIHNISPLHFWLNFPSLSSLFYRLLFPSLSLSVLSISQPLPGSADPACGHLRLLDFPFDPISGQYRTENRDSATTSSDLPHSQVTFSSVHQIMFNLSFSAHLSALGRQSLLHTGILPRLCPHFRFQYSCTLPFATCQL